MNKQTKALISLLESYTKKKVVLKEFEVTRGDDPNASAKDDAITMYDEIQIELDNCISNINNKISTYKSEHGKLDADSIRNIKRLLQKYFKNIVV